MIQMLQTMGQFSGMPVEDPHLHLYLFMEVSDSFKLPGVSEGALGLKLFQYSLQDRARAWLNSLPPSSVSIWSEKVLEPKIVETKDDPAVVHNQKKVQPEVETPTVQNPIHLHVNIPLVEALEKMSNYVKVMKDILSKKRRQLGIGEVRATIVTLQLADRLIAHPEGKIEDILVCVDKYIFPIDFLILDFEADKAVPIILGRPFLATRITLIDVQKGELTMRVQDDQTELSFPTDDSLEQLLAANMLSDDDDDGNRTELEAEFKGFNS
ncbi:Retrovirus-related Pol polyprotein from transposon opus [Gossypium australe]|uniref:Retrovirus-related Pol polyprotein from transposon opus n=1 Tax=Gossypium australe TaxID=47621 RepID=A0A5B6X3P1_9ROSI|nr:Retrovirus-related Pol polyprotein from transposon opus [Gossypium australe]